MMEWLRFFMEISLMLHEGVIVNLEEEARALIAWPRRPVPVTPNSFFVRHRFTRNVLIAFAWHTTPVTFTSSSFLEAINHARLQLRGPSQPILTPHHRRIGSCKLHNWAIKDQEGLEFLVFDHYGKPVLCGRKIP